jgi:hypothetical protein
VAQRNILSFWSAAMASKDSGNGPPRGCCCMSMGAVEGIRMLPLILSSLQVGDNGSEAKVA